MRKIVLILIIAFNPFESKLFAQKVFNSVEEAWEYALANNPENTINQLKIDQAVEDKKTAKSFRYPRISTGFAGQKNLNIAETPVPGELVGAPGQTVYIKFGQNYSYNANLTINKTLLDWQTIYQSRIAKVNISLQGAQKNYFEQTLKEQIAQFYYATLTAAKAVAIAKNDMEFADSLLMLTNDKLKQGLIDATVLNQAKINRNNAFEKLEQNNQFHNQYLGNLKLMIGLTANDSIVLTEKLLGNKYETKNQFSISNEKYTEIYRLQMLMSEYDVKKAKSRWAPRFDYMHYIGLNQYQNDFTLSFNSEDWKPSNYFALSVSIPIFAGFSNRSQLQSAKISRNIAELNYQNKVRTSAIQDSILINTYISSAEIAQSAAESFEISRSNVELTAQKYSQGMVGLDEYLKVFDDYLMVENQYLSKLSDYLVNKATIKARK
jgi:outer membrane protein TolC